MVLEKHQTPFTTYLDKGSDVIQLLHHKVIEVGFLFPRVHFRITFKKVLTLDPLALPTPLDGL